MKYDRIALLQFSVVIIAAAFAVYMMGQNPIGLPVA